MGDGRRLQEKFFSKFTPSTVPRPAVAKCLRLKRFGSDEEAYQPALLYVVMHVLVSNAKKVIILVQFLQLADNIELFNAYPWDTVAYEETHNSVK